MNLIKKIQNHPRTDPVNFQIVRRFFICAIILINFNMPGKAQPKYTQPSWWIGIAGGANFNQYSGSFNKINQDLSFTTPYKHGFGVGGFVAPLLEYHRPKSVWGAMLQMGLDNRRAEFEKPNKELFLRISYFTVEPSIRIAPFKSNFYLFGGPRLGFLWSTSLKYKSAGLPDYPNPNDPNSEAYISHLKKNLITM